MNATNPTARLRSARRAGYLAGVAFAAALPLLAAAAPAHAEGRTTFSANSTTSLPAPGEDDGQVTLPDVDDTVDDVLDVVVDIHDWG